MTKEVPKKVAPRGPKPETVSIEGEWADALKYALTRGKPPAEVGKPKARKKKRPPKK